MITIRDNGNVYEIFKTQDGIYIRKTKYIIMPKGTRAIITNMQLPKKVLKALRKIAEVLV